MTIYLVTVGDTRHHYAPHTETFTSLRAAQTYALKHLHELDIRIPKFWTIDGSDWDLHTLYTEGVVYVRFTSTNLPQE